MARQAGNQTIRYGLFVGLVMVLAVAGYSGYALYPRFDLPAVSGIGLVVLAAAAGIASFFSPCSFGLLVSLLARGAAPAPGQRRRVAGRAIGFALALAIGASIFLLLTGLVIALGGDALFAGITFTSATGRVVRAVVGVLLTFLGLVQLGRVSVSSFGAIGEGMTPLLRMQARVRRERPVLGVGLLGFSYVLAGFG